MSLATSETHRKRRTFSPAAAAAPAPATPSVQKAAPGWESTMAVKDGKAANLRPKTA